MKHRLFTFTSGWPTAVAALMLSLAMGVPAASADSGVSDDRVSLPEGPGSIEGIGENVSIDPNMGLMRHGVGIDVPAGFGGVTPSLSLGYSSGSGSDIVGVGWNMGWPSIERMTMRGVPRYGEQDLFAANGGEELVRVSAEGIGASEPAFYRARFEKGFVRYLWRAREGGIGGYWEAQYPNGSIGYFGASADGTIVPEAIEQGDVGGQTGSFKYHLVEKVDLFGHSMRHTYIKDGAHSLLSSVGYVFTDGTPTYEVTMDYAPRVDWVSDAKSGFERVLTQRLTAVHVFSRGQEIRSYGLTYEDYETASNRSRLQKVERFGLGGVRYPVVHTFGYSSALGAQCASVDCGEPYVIEMVGDAGLGISLASGKASLIDINGDALPDLVDTADTNPQHRFFINRMASDGTHTFDPAPVASAVGTPTAFPLDNPRVQMIDINGDGFTDIVNGFSGEALINRGGGDWDELLQLDAGNGYPTVGDDVELRFMDYNNDMRIDLVRSGIGSATAYENTGQLGFVERPLGDLGTQFSEGVQFTDINGDGLLDIAQILPNQLRYRLNLGWGTFKDWVILETPFSGSDAALASLEDLNGDGYADIAVTSGTQVSYVLNRNGERFDPVQTISEAGGQVLPERGPNTLVLAADMNGNGSVDIVWVGENGGVQYLELFPVRPHLLNRIENGLGRVTDITYQTSVEQRALAAEEGRQWQYPLPHPMVVVSRVDEWDKLTFVHDVRDLRYFDGFYDGNERQFRGYAQVETVMPEAASALEGRITARYDVGAVEPHRNGLQLETTRFTDGKVVDLTTLTYGDDTTCPVAEVPAASELEAKGLRAVRFPCQIASETVIQEGLTEDRWITTGNEMVYDGYGNVVRSVSHGVVAEGGGGCQPCTHPDDTYGAACGPQCVGDEQIIETTYVPPSATGGRWMLSFPSRTRAFGRDGDARVAETVTYYDGDAFVGLAEGQLTQGKVSRVSRKVAQGEFIDVTRSAFDVHGNVVESLGPLGVPGGTTHRRIFTFEPEGLRITQADMLVETPEGEPYTLRRTISYESVFDKPSLGSQWVRVVGGAPQTASNEMAYTYDVFGRPETMVMPGDTGAEPTFSFDYALADPASAVTTRRRSTVGGPEDLETVKCFDGRGRGYQVRRKVSPGRYLVDGFTIYNLRSDKLELYQPYESDSAACDDAPPEGVRRSSMRYDGVGRMIEARYADGDETTAGSLKRLVYEPLKTLTYDAEDVDPASPHHDTPTVRHADGRGRAAVLTRLLSDGSAEHTELRYDGLGHLTHVVDANGNRKVQTHDLMGRLLKVVDPNAGTTSYAYDQASNRVRRTDGRGVVTEMAYDGLNRIAAHWDASAPEATLVAYEYDVSAACDPAVCTNGAGLPVAAYYPGGADFRGYDQRRRNIAEARSFGDQTYVTRTDYDAADRATARIYPDGTRLEHVYDGLNRLKAIPTVVSDITYDERGDLATITRANGVVDTYDYDARQRLMGVATVQGDGQVLQELALARDRMDNVLRVEDAAPNALLNRSDHAYDAWYRLVKGAPESAEAVFNYDAIDNLMAMGDTTFGYDAGRPGAKNRAGQSDLVYDAAGQLTNAKGWAHTWDHLGRLIESRRDDASGAVVVSNYGQNNVRIGKRSGGFSTRYVSDDFEVRDGIAVIYPRLGNTRIARIETTAAAASWLGDPVADGRVDSSDAWVAQRDGDDAGRWLASAARRVLAETRSPVVQLHTNHLRSVVLATGDDGAVEGRRAFGVYGDTTSHLGFVDRYGFTGQEHDDATGLVHFAFRFLDPSMGQWISPDPAFEAATSNSLEYPAQLVGRYAYAVNNPTTNIDPDGRIVFKRKRASEPSQRSVLPGGQSPLQRGSVWNRIFSSGGGFARVNQDKVALVGNRGTTPFGMLQIEAHHNAKVTTPVTNAPRTEGGVVSTNKFVWALVKNAAGEYNVVIAPKTSEFGHASLMYDNGKPIPGLAAAGELRYSGGRWRMNSNSELYGRGPEPTSRSHRYRRQRETRNNVLFAASLMQQGRGDARPIITHTQGDWFSRTVTSQ